MPDQKDKVDAYWLCLTCNQNFSNADGGCNCQSTKIEVKNQFMKVTNVPGYLLEKEVGQGSSATIYKATSIKRGGTSTVAIKILHASTAHELESVMRFRREAELTKTITSPNVIAVLDFDVLDDGRPFTVMEFIEGKCARSLLNQFGPIPIERALLLFIQIAGGLAAIHHAGVLHRDIKPENIMISDKYKATDAAKIIDFGIAKHDFQSQDDPLILTKQGESVGSPDYMSPEQCMGAVIDQRSDIYSFGCLMYEMLTGLSVFAITDNPVEMMQKQINEVPQIARLRRVEGSGRMESIVSKCLEKLPQARYFDASEIKGALLQLSESLQI
ncbi:hypothetical protein BH11CYA1_BH11CYA1_08410 [soil metagenome]